MLNVFKLVRSNLGGLTDFALALLDKNKEVYFHVVTKEKAKSIAQNRTFHGLLGMWVKSGHSSYEDVEHAKAYYKLKASIIDCYLYIDGEKIEKVATRDEIPAHIPLHSCRRIAGSWSRATRKQAIAAIDMLIDDMYKSGYSSKRFDEMLESFAEWR